PSSDCSTSRSSCHPRSSRPCARRATAASRSSDSSCRPSWEPPPFLVDGFYVGAVGRRMAAPHPPSTSRGSLRGARWYRVPMRRALAGVVLFLILAAAAVFAACALLPRYPSAAPRKDVWPEEKLEKSMNPWFLGDGFSDRIEIEVDWVAGCKPGPHTIEGLRSIAVKYAPAGVPVDVTLDDEIPRAEWDATAKRAGDRVDPLVLKHADYAH